MYRKDKCFLLTDKIVFYVTLNFTVKRLIWVLWIQFQCIMWNKNNLNICSEIYYSNNFMAEKYWIKNAEKNSEILIKSTNILLYYF